MTVDRNILPGMKPTRHSFRCGQPLGPGVAHHGMHNLVHHAQAHVASPRGERLPAQVADHLSDAAYVVVTVASVPGRSALKKKWPDHQCQPLLTELTDNSQRVSLFRIFYKCDLQAGLQLSVFLPLERANRLTAHATLVTELSSGASKSARYMVPFLPANYEGPIRAGRG